MFEHYHLSAVRVFFCCVFEGCSVAGCWGGGWVVVLVRDGREAESKKIVGK